MSNGGKGLRSDSDRIGFLLQVPGVLKTLIRWGGFVAVVYIIASNLAAFAGHKTIAVLFTDLRSNFISLSLALRLNIAISWTISLMAVLYGVGQRRLRKTTVKRLQERVVDLERQLHPNRSSSGIHPMGHPKPEDR